MYTTRLLDNRNRAHLDAAADVIAQGEIVAFGFNGIFVFIGDADQAIAARRIAAAKRQPFDKPLVLMTSDSPQKTLNKMLTDEKVPLAKPDKPEKSDTPDPSEKPEKPEKPKKPKKPDMPEK